MNDLSRNAEIYFVKRTTEKSSPSSAGVVPPKFIEFISGTIRIMTFLKKKIGKMFKKFISVIEIKLVMEIM